MCVRAQTAVLLQWWHIEGRAAQFVSADGMIDKDIDEEGHLLLCLHMWESISATDINAPPTGPLSVHYRVNSSLNDFSEVTSVF